MNAKSVPLAAAAVLAAIAACPSLAQNGPILLDPRERLAKPDLASVPRIRFLTTLDFPPFSFAGPDGRIAGYNIDLARAICVELEVIERCEVQAMDWDEIAPAMAAGQGEAVLAGVEITAETRKTYDFSRPYFVFPARLVTRKSDVATLNADAGLSGRRVGVVGGSPHAAMLAAWFPSAVAVALETDEALHAAVKDAAVDAGFGDGVALSFWLASEKAAGCCAFAGGPYISDVHLGTGMAIAFRKNVGILAAAADYALRELQAKGTLAELYVRYFPVDLFAQPD